MMLLNNRRNIGIAAGVLLLAGVGAAAWMHESGSRPAPAVAVDGNSQQPVATNYAANNATAQNGGGNAGGYYPSIPPPAFISQPQPVAQPAVEEEATDGQYASDDQYAERGGVVTYRGHREHRHGRSKAHSIEIVAGTAAAGAAIGAIAGGGPGAAIGAISGAGAGFTYDRLTHNH